MTTKTVGPRSPVTMTAPANVTSGQGLLVGSAFGVVGTTVASGALMALHTEGQHTLPKATGAAWAVGDIVYWDDSAKNVTKTSSGNTKIGYATSVQASGDTTGVVNLNGTV